MWHQIDEVLSVSSESILEIGPGPSILKKVALYYDIDFKTVDVDPDLKPDFVSSVVNLPFEDSSYQCVCAFQVLEHLPYQESLKGLKEMVRVSSRYIIISLPDAKKIWFYSIHIPLIGRKVFHVPKPGKKEVEHKFDGQHYWEINKKGYSIEKVVDDFLTVGHGCDLKKNYRVPENPYHRFFVFEKKQGELFQR